MTQALVAQTYHPPFFELSVYKFIFNKISLFLIIKQYSILSIFNQSYRHCSHINSADIFFSLTFKNDRIIKEQRKCLLSVSQAVMAQNYPSSFFLLSVYIFIIDQISSLFHLFFLILTCSCQYSYNLMLTSNCMCRPYIDTNDTILC